MKAKRFVAIGLLTAAAIALVGCAIALSKKNKQYQPKVMQTNAYYNIKTYNYNTKAFTIEGYTNENFNLLNEDKEINTIAIYKYTVNYNGTNTYVNIETLEFINKDEEIWELENPLTTEFNYYNVKPNTITINQSTTNTNIITYNVKINTQWLTKNTEITNPEITIYNSEPIETEYATFQQTINLIEYEYQTAYTTGYQNKGDLTDGNFINIRNMMLSVLTMPFTFINQAFNVTLWEGTAYEFNIGNFIKGIIAIATILFIIRVFTSGFSIIGNYTNDARAKKDTSNLRRSQTELNKAKTRRESKLADKGK